MTDSVLCLGDVYEPRGKSIDLAVRKACEQDKGVHGGEMHDGSAWLWKGCFEVDGRC